MLCIVLLPLFGYFKCALWCAAQPIACHRGLAFFYARGNYHNWWVRTHPSANNMLREEGLQTSFNQSCPDKDGKRTILSARLIWHASRPIVCGNGRGDHDRRPPKSFVGTYNIDVSRPLAGLQTRTNTVVCFIKMHSDASSKYNSKFSKLFVCWRQVLTCKIVLHSDRSTWHFVTRTVRFIDAFMSKVAVTGESIQIIRLTLSLLALSLCVCTPMSLVLASDSDLASIIAGVAF